MRFEFTDAENTEIRTTLKTIYAKVKGKPGGLSEAMGLAVVMIAHKTVESAKRFAQELHDKQAEREAALRLKCESLEHRVSRQATHLQNLTDRIKAMETK